MSADKKRKLDDQLEGDLGLSETISSSSTCPYCSSASPSTHPSSLATAYTDWATFKTNVNAALEGKYGKDNYDTIRVLLLNWEENDMGPSIETETKELQNVFENDYGFEAEYLKLRGEFAQNKLHGKLFNIIDEFEQDKQKQKK